MRVITGSLDAFESSSSRGIGSLALCALVMASAYGLIHAAASPADQIGTVLLAYAASGSAFAWLLWRCRRNEPGGDSPAVWVLVLGAALLFRLILLGLEPATSSDVYRYLWEGRVQAAGGNPYVHAPDAKALGAIAAARPAVHANVNHPDIASIYPPTAQLLFRANAVLFGGSLMGWKVILLFFDALLGVGGWLMLRRRRGGALGLAALLWCPLLLVETYEGGHVDIIGVSLMVLSIAAMERGRWMISAIAIGLSIQVKYLWPGLALVLLIAQARALRRAVPFVLISALVTAALWWPYRAGFTAAAETASYFAGVWSFNGVLFTLFRQIPGPPWLAMALVLAVLGGLAVHVGRHQRQDFRRDIWLICGTGLLLSPVAYPWYFLWILPAVLDRPGRWWSVWILSVPALHVVGWRHLMTGLWQEMVWLSVAVTAVPLVLLLAAWRDRLAGTFGEKIAAAAGGSKPSSGWNAAGGRRETGILERGGA